MTADPTNPSLPSAPANLIKKFAPGWTHHVSGPCTGTLTVGGLSEETRSDGTRWKIERHVPVTSYALKACHRATGRALVAVWVQEAGYVPTGKLDARWHTATTSKRKRPRTRAPLLMLVEPAAVALLTVLLRYKPRPCSLDMAYRGRHDGEHTPQALNAQQLTLYATTSSVAEYAAALDGLAMRKARKAEVTELRTSVGTDPMTVPEKEAA